MEAPVAVVIRLPRPRDELRFVLLPSGGEIRRLQARSLKWSVWRLWHRRRTHGAEGDRTPDLVTASHALSHLSYGPTKLLSLASKPKSSAPLMPRRWLLRLDVRAKPQLIVAVEHVRRNEVATV